MSNGFTCVYEQRHLHISGRSIKTDHKSKSLMASMKVHHVFHDMFIFEMIYLILYIDRDSIERLDRVCNLHKVCLS